MSYLSIILVLFGCGGTTGGGTSPIPPTITSLAVSCAPNAIQAPATSNCTTTVAGTGAYTSGVSFAATPNTIGTINSATGVFTTATPAAAGTATVTACSTMASYTTVCGTATIAVTIPPTITLVTASANPTTITMAQTSQCSSVVSGTGAFSTGVTWIATGGTITPSGVFTPTATGNGTCTATSVQNPAFGGTVSITVTIAPPTITSLNVASIYCESTGNQCGPVITINGTNFAAGDNLSLPVFGSITLGNGTSSTQLLNQLFFNTYDYSPGFFTYKDCHTAPNPTTCSTPPSSFVFLGPQNTLTVSASGELFQNDQAQGVLPPALGGTGINGYVREFQASGATLTPGASPQLGFSYSIAYDDTASKIVLGTTFYPGSATNGSVFDGPSNAGCGSNPVIANAAKSGYATYTCPGGNIFGVYPLTPNPTAAFTTLTGQPSAVAMGTTSTGTSEYVLLRLGTVTLEKLDTSANPKASIALPGITSISTVQAANPFAGGWAIAYGQGGTADQTAAVLSTPDAVLDIVNTATMQVMKSVTLSGIPFRVVYDATHGTYIVAYANLANTTTTFASVNPSTGVVTPMTSTSSLLAVGLAVDPTGTYLYVCMRSVCETQLNR